MSFNYPKICNTLLKNLPERARVILEKRFGLKDLSPQTLESIGKDFGITRERVRQIEAEGLETIKKKAGEFPEGPFQYLDLKFKLSGGLKKEEKILSEWDNPQFQNYILFLLTIGDRFKRFGETKDFYSLWTIEQRSLESAKKVIDSFTEEMRKQGHPLSIGDYNPPKTLAFLPFSLTNQVLSSYLEISKNIMTGPQGLYGFFDWPEVNPRGIRDKAYLVFKKEKRPLHFTEVAALIDKLSLSKTTKKTLSQSVHNELIKDPRFVLVGRGLYALQEWGYTPGAVKEVILKILKEEKQSLSKEEIIKKVLEQRKVKGNTILLNLYDKKYFLKDSQGRYTIRKA